MGKLSSPTRCPARRDKVGADEAVLGGSKTTQEQLEDLGKQAKGEFLQGVGTAIQGASEVMTPPRVAKVPPDVGGFEDEDALPGRLSFCFHVTIPPAGTG